MFNHITHKSGIESFAVSSGALQVTDPCYDLDTWCAGAIHDVKNGTWLAQVGYTDDERPAYLRIVHESEREVMEKDDLSGDYYVSDIDVGVDSGQAGLFDLKAFEATNPGKHGDPIHEAFYSRVCELTLADASFGVVEFGAVSSSGYGDGSYTVTVRRDAFDQVVDAYILFINEDSDED